MEEKYLNLSVKYNNLFNEQVELQSLYDELMFNRTEEKYNLCCSIDEEGLDETWFKGEYTYSSDYFTIKGNLTKIEYYIDFLTEWAEGNPICWIEIIDNDDNKVTSFTISENDKIELEGSFTRIIEPGEYKLQIGLLNGYIIRTAYIVVWDYY